MKDHCSVFIDAGAVVLLPTDLTGQDRLDVLNSVLFAQLVASKKYPALARSSDWYSAYREVLNNGWMQKAVSWDNFTLAASSKTHLMGCVEERLGEYVERTLITQVTDVLKRVAQLSSTLPAIELLREHAHRPKSPDSSEVPHKAPDRIRLQVILAQPGPVLSSVCLEFEPEHVTPNPLGQLFSTHPVVGNIQLRCFKASLSQALYAPFRDAIVHKLGDKAARNIIDISAAVEQAQPGTGAL